ncbi:MAG: hypothetical protein KGP28_08480 [Bdellovibrionales bacterium]|nr:hypothetical protein [Bdellovibrionales bacterium]
MKLFFFLLFSFTTVHADPFILTESSSRKLFSLLERGGATVHQLNHQRDREYATLESVRAEHVDCEMSLTPTCRLTYIGDSNTLGVLTLAREEAADIGFALGDAGLTRIVVSSEMYTVSASRIHCLRKGAGKSVTCRAHQ